MGCMIRAKLEVNTARLKKLVLLAEVSTASRGSTASRTTVSAGNYSQHTPQFPPGFTPDVEKNVAGSGKPQSSYTDSQEDGTSFVNKVKESVVAYAMGYNMDGCTKNIESIIGSQEMTRSLDEFLVVKRSRPCDGDWIVDPFMVKNEFLNHFANHFTAPTTECISFAFQFPNQLSPDQANELESSVSYDEIKNNDVVAAVSFFFSSGLFPPGCNSSFIALIPKTQEAKLVNDFRPISLIGSLYKIITKVLARRLSHVIPTLVSDVQSAFVSNRQILDGPFILNELLSWCKHKKSKALIFKIDFEKAFDSVRWDYLVWAF
ncbi:RNA-directed DNA polymerase, eukaryota [Tanacetum coccineum]|uniref:RNA-directed DNA polymerase, eukaryota n=1 Tax=Tanacetum coccineum TaxID=301880 RepID=A0ABQ5AEN8_9ASTR